MQGFSPSDIDLLAGIKNDTPGMFEQLFNAHWEALYRQAYRRLRNQSEAEDLVQDIFADIWERRHSLEVTTSLPAYLYAAVKYKIIKRVANADLQRKTLDYLLLQMGQVENTVLDLLAIGEMNRTLEMAIRGFPENMRKIFLMRAEAFTVAEIAEALGLSEQTVKNNTTEALRRLRIILAEKHPDIPPSFYLLLAVLIQN